MNFTFTFDEVTMEGDNDISTWLQELDQNGEVIVLSQYEITPQHANTYFCGGRG
jgi:hypothetical protein